MENCHLLVYSFQNLFWQVTGYLSWWGLSTFQILFIIYIYIYIYFLVKYVILYWKKIYLTPVQFSSVTQSCPTLWDPMDCSMPCFCLHHQLPEPIQTHVHHIGDAYPTVSPSAIPFSSCLQSFPVLGSFPMRQFFTSGGQSIGVSASASVFPMNIED